MAIERGEKLTKGQRRYLSRRACAWCDMPLDMDGCGAIYEKCSEQSRAERQANCLKNYKPRSRLVPVGGEG